MCGVVVRYGGLLPALALLCQLTTVECGLAQTAEPPNPAPANPAVNPAGAIAPEPPVANSKTAAPAADDTSSTIKQIIATNAATPKNMCGAIKPILFADPNAASAVIDEAQSQPELMESLCECLSQTQTALKGKDPEGAKTVAKAVAGSSPAFQACYAVALAPTDTAAPPATTPAPTQTAATGDSGGGLGGGNFAPFSALATPNNIGVGGGAITSSPN